METSDISGVEPEGFPLIPKSLNPAILVAICELVSNRTGKKFSFMPKNTFKPEEAAVADPSQLAMAVAYVSLCLDEPEMVTSSHLKMLRSNFSYEQIQELTLFIKKLIA